jgi:RimJ/RimL family protein N-acetyltransferase
MELQTTALFTHDAAGRIVAINETDGDPAPRLFLGRTRQGNVWRLRHDLPDEIAAELERILSSEPPLNDPRQPPTTLTALRDALSAHAPVIDVVEGPAWRFPETIPEPEDVVVIGPGNVAALRVHFPWSADHLDDLQPNMAILAEGVAIAVCSSVRLTPEVAEAGVYTLEAYRGRGYAAQVAAAWAAAVRASGRIPLYSTSWDNTASQTVARKLGLIFYGVDLSID